MENKTQPVLELVKDVMDKMNGNYGEDVIEDTCLLIEGNAKLLERYDLLCRRLGKTVVNNWIGQYAKEMSGMSTIAQVPATRMKIMASYSRLRR